MNGLLSRPGCLRRALCAAAWLLAAVPAGGAGVAHAQFAERPRAAAIETSAREVPAGQTINLFAEWEGETPVDGFYAHLPPGWRLEAVTGLQSNGTRRVPLSVRPSDEGGATHFIGTEETLRGPVRLVLRVQTGAAPGRVEWSLVPFTYRAEDRLRRLRADRLERRLRVARIEATPENRALSFQKAGAPLLLEAARLPALSTRAPFTVEAWLKTTGLGEVVLSTWDGAEERPYPLELVVGSGGRLRYYRGRQGRHESMATPVPVADGTWHHVAVTHDPEAGRTRLLLDGQAVDSLRGTVPLEPSGNAVALGGRVPAPRSPQAEKEDAAPPNGFSGQLDAVHFWPQARPEEAVRRAMRKPRRSASSQGAGTAGRRLSTDEPGSVLLSFDEEDALPALARRVPPGVERVRSGLRFLAPITDLRARTSDASSGAAASGGAASGGAVALSWTAPGRGTFVIERAAADREDFRPVGQQEAQQGRQRYSFTDAEASGEVVFYRIRQQLPGGGERTSGTLKVGRGTPEAPQEGVTLMGNFPNPFSDETTIAYQVHDETPVQLSVWSLTGQRVATLLNETQSAGHKKVTFRPEGLSSGTYFVRLRAGGQTYTHKMALVK